VQEITVNQTFLLFPEKAEHAISFLLNAVFPMKGAGFPSVYN